MSIESKEHAFPITPAQESILSGQLLNADNYRFNAGFYFLVPPDINKQLLLAAAKELAQECTLQRIKLYYLNGQWQQITAISAEDVTKLLNLQTLSQAEAWMDKQLEIPMQLDGGEPLYRQWFIETEEGSNLFFVKYHHFVLDGFGQSLILKRLEALYKKISGQNCSVDNEKSWTGDKEYFDGVFSGGKEKQYAMLQEVSESFGQIGEVTTLGVVRSHFATGLLQSRRTIDMTAVQQLQKISSEFNVPESVLFTAIVAAFFYFVSGNEKIVLGLPVSARVNRGLLNKPSMQSNEYPLVFDFSTLIDASGAIDIAMLIVQLEIRVSNPKKYRK